jgi:hypothetical protein
MFTKLINKDDAARGGTRAQLAPLAPYRFAKWKMEYFSKTAIEERQLLCLPSA